MCVDAEPPCIISVRVQLMLYMFIKLVCETHSSVHLYLIRNRPLKLQPNLRRISLRSVSRQHRCQRIYQAFRLALPTIQAKGLHQVRHLSHQAFLQIPQHFSHQELLQTAQHFSQQAFLQAALLKPLQ